MIVRIPTGKSLTAQDNAPYLSRDFVSPETMAYSPRCPVLLFEKQCFQGIPAWITLGPECESLRLETEGKGKNFADEGDR